MSVAKDAQPRSANYDGLTGKGAVGPPCACRIVALADSPRSFPDAIHSLSLMLHVCASPA